MSHLIIEQGKDVGTEVTVPHAGMKFGRSPANDFVLDDDSVMLFQGRFFFKSDGSLWLTDFSAAEKTTIGGTPVEEQMLKVGDLVEIGSMAFRVIDIKAIEEPNTAEPSETVDQEKSIDLGFQAAETVSKRRDPKPSGGKSHSFVHRLLQVVVVLLVVLVVALAIPEIMNLKGAKIVPHTEQDRFLAFTYECVRGNYKDIFRYKIELTPEGMAFIEIDNLGNRHNAKSVEISAESIEKLSRRLAGSGFFDIDRNYVIDAPGSYDYYDIAVYCNGRFNNVKVLNKEMPQDFRRTISILEEFAFTELDIPSTLLEDEETLVRLAAESFKLGEARFSERDVKIGNLALAIKHYAEALDYLETLDLKPDLYGRIKMGMAKAKAEQDVRYRDYKFNADRAMRLGDWREADRQLRVLVELIPDREDHRHETIVAKQLEVEEYLR